MPILLFVSLTPDLLSGQRPVFELPRGAKLYVSPMEWHLDQYIAAEIRKSGLSVTLVNAPEEADFVMTGTYQSLGSHLMSPGHYIQVKIAAARDGKQVWFAEANDYALFFGRMRQHGPGRVATSVVKKLNQNMAGK